MIFKTHRVLTLFFILVSLFTFLPWALGASQEIRTAAQLTGIIVGPMEERKQALSSGDKIFVSLDRPRLVKKGDLLEIFQPTILPGNESKDFFFTRMGRPLFWKSSTSICYSVSFIPVKKKLPWGIAYIFPKIEPREVKTHASSGEKTPRFFHDSHLGFMAGNNSIRFFPNNRKFLSSNQFYRSKKRIHPGHHTIGLLLVRSDGL